MAWKIKEYTFNQKAKVEEIKNNKIEKIENVYKDILEIVRGRTPAREVSVFQVPPSFLEAIDTAYESVKKALESGCNTSIIDEYVALATDADDIDDSYVSLLKLLQALGLGRISSLNSSKFSEVLPPEVFCEVLVKLCNLKDPDISRKFEENFPELLEHAKRRRIAKTVYQLIKEEYLDEMLPLIYMEGVERNMTEKEIKESIREYIDKVITESYAMIEKLIKELGCNCTVEDVLNEKFTILGMCKNLKEYIEQLRNNGLCVYL